MKKLAYALLALALLLPVIAIADGTLEVDGTVEAARTQTLLAPYSGTISGVDADPGDVLAAGHALLNIGTTKLYADYDGTVTGVFAQPGDSATSVADRYGALCYVEREDMYEAKMKPDGAGTNNEIKIIHAGERVYVRSRDNANRKGMGVVTNVNGRRFTLVVTDVGNLRFNETVKAYRTDEYKFDDCLGTGEMTRINPVALTGEGYVLAVYVEEGQQVSRGDVLMELVPDVLDGMQGGNGTITLPEDAVVISVEAKNGQKAAKDDVLLTYCPQDELKVVCPVDEDDLNKLAVGDVMRVTLDAYPDEELAGTVTEISGVGKSDGGRVKFDVTLQLEENTIARMGMSATAEK